MLTLDPGPFKTKGFTLLELLVVIVVLSIAAGMIVVKGTPGDSNYLESDARKLSQLLRIAQQEALLKSKDIRFVAGEQGYAFEEFTGSRWVPVKSEPMLRARQWDHGPFQVDLLNEGRKNSFLTIEATSGLAQQTIVLQRNRVQVALQKSTSGLFKVTQPRTVLAQSTAQ